MDIARYVLCWKMLVCVDCIHFNEKEVELCISGWSGNVAHLHTLSEALFHRERTAPIKTVCNGIS